MTMEDEYPLPLEQHRSSKAARESSRSRILDTSHDPYFALGDTNRSSARLRSLNPRTSGSFSGCEDDSDCEDDAGEEEDEGEGEAEGDSDGVTSDGRRGTGKRITGVGFLSRSDEKRSRKTAATGAKGLLGRARKWGGRRLKIVIGISLLSTILALAGGGTLMLATTNLSQYLTSTASSAMQLHTVPLSDSLWQLHSVPALLTSPLAPFRKIHARPLPPSPVHNPSISVSARAFLPAHETSAHKTSVNEASANEASERVKAVRATASTPGLRRPTLAETAPREPSESDSTPHLTSVIVEPSAEEKAFEQFYLEHRKNREYVFGSPEYYRRFLIYQENNQLIDAHNAKVDAHRRAKHHAHREKNKDKLKYLALRENQDPDYRVKLRVNQFADLTYDEFAHHYLKTVPHSTIVKAIDDKDVLALGDEIESGAWHLKHVAKGAIPDALNWAERGCVTEVKDQAKCGSCWAFSATGAIEGAVCAQTGHKAVSLSEQQLIDCAGPEGEHGCSGGLMDRAFRYVTRAGGLCQESDYPYAAAVQQCQPCSKFFDAQVKGFVNVPADDPGELQKALALHGPVSAAIEADRPSFQFYHTGVFGLKCGKKLNHAILVVGYGGGKDAAPNNTDDRPTNNNPAPGGNTGDEVPYWVIKNSWGSTWGDGGFVKLARAGKHCGHKGECGILMQPIIPLVEVPKTADPHSEPEPEPNDDL